MESPADSPAHARSRRRVRTAAARPSPPALTLVLPAIVLLVAGCGGRVVPAPSAAWPLVTGGRVAPIPPARLASATAAARSLTRTWIPTLYLRRPPRLSGATPSVRREQLLAALRVPPDRRGLVPRVAGEELRITGPDRVEVLVHVVDGRSPAFTLGAELVEGAAGWRVSSISSAG